MIFFSPAF